MFFRQKSEDNAADLAQQTLASIADPEPAASAKKILLVDDDAVTLTAIAMKLKAQGYRVLTAQDGCSALEASRRDKPDLMLLDVNFPPTVGGVEWDGFLIAEWLKRRDGAKASPLMLMSGIEQPDYKKRASSAGATAFLSKPLNQDELLHSIKLALNGKSDA